LAQIIVNQRYKKGDFKIPIHLAMGHEAIAVAVDCSMEDGDSLLLTHRNIHYNLARAKTLGKELDEYYLLDTGIGRGHCGSMNMYNPDKNIVYTSSILGNNLPVGCGYALGNKAKNNKSVVFIITGDGAIEEGAFYESLVFMKSNNLKTVIIVENNQWSLGTKIDERRCSIDLKKLTGSLGIDYLALKGNNPFQYIDAIRSCRSNVYETNTPALIEVQLTTLGYWYMETEEYPEGKFINYHAGPAPEVEMMDYPLICANTEDPLFILKKYLTKAEAIQITSIILEELKKEII
jgi:TPP-dependent pyruvate/acetoin dehydrogenase alpha subunit